MGRRYYCDFCDKAFSDNPASKKNHFNGTFHQQMRKAHYDSFRDPASILAAESAKKPCHKFQQTGLCDYGDGCRFSHLTEDKRRELQEQCRQNQQRGSTSTSVNQTTIAIGEVSDWLAKRANRQTSVDASSGGGKRRRRRLPQYHLPPHLAGVSDLPPSLLPPTKEDFVGLPRLEWG
ncbi:hypothetical protein ACOMHN_056747 [Nucella lapillus]